MLCASGPRFFHVFCCLALHVRFRAGSYFLPPAARASRIHFSKPLAGKGLL